MANKLKSIRTDIKTTLAAINGAAPYNYNWSGKVEIDRKSELAKDESLHANIRLSNFDKMPDEFVGGDANQWERFADIDIEIEKSEAAITDDEILNAEEDIERAIKANKHWSALAERTEWLGTNLEKDQQERVVLMAIVKLRIYYMTTEWLPE